MPKKKKTTEEVIEAEVVSEKEEGKKMSDKKLKKDDFVKVQKEVNELTKEYDKKHNELRKEYFEKVKELVPEEMKPKFVKKGDFKPEEVFKNMPKPVFMMNEEEVKELVSKRKEFVKKLVKKDPFYKLFEMVNAKKDED